eukprot:TRINITY_DN14033_c0_g1_i1.p1 TRINITY_DN14033_c0_g1~~TRINITY_DN14033_c0_g1_i1.p1  ORF type:complete len:239 (-),score=31.46 TRINITY_DN14033_c0_g1_i1:187-903(-)
MAANPLEVVFECVVCCVVSEVDKTISHQTEDGRLVLVLASVCQRARYICRDLLLRLVWQAAMNKKDSKGRSTIRMTRLQQIKDMIDRFFTSNRKMTLEIECFNSFESDFVCTYSSAWKAKSARHIETILDCTTNPYLRIHGCRPMFNPKDRVLNIYTIIYSRHPCTLVLLTANPPKTTTANSKGLVERSFVTEEKNSKPNERILSEVYVDWKEKLKRQLRRELAKQRHQKQSFNEDKT